MREYTIFELEEGKEYRNYFCRLDLIFTKHENKIFSRYLNEDTQDCLERVEAPLYNYFISEKVKVRYYAYPTWNDRNFNFKTFEFIFIDKDNKKLNIPIEPLQHRLKADDEGIYIEVEE